MASVSVAELIEFAPEFTSASNALINAKLTEAERRCPVKSWGSGTDLQIAGIKNKAAQLLARSPWARDMKFVNDDGKTSWDDEVMRLNRIAAAGRGRVTGQP